MITRFVAIDLDAPLPPPDLREWVPSENLAHVVLDALDTIDESKVRENRRGTGHEK